MEKILENLVNVEREDTPPSTVHENTTATLPSVNNQTQLSIPSTTSRMDATLPEEKEVNSTVEEEMDDVMNVLKDLNDVASGTFATSTNNGVTKTSTDNNVVSHNVESLTSVQDVAKVVDFSKTCLTDSSSHSPISPYQAAEEKFEKLSVRQAEIEKRFASLSYRINQMRCRQFGSHVVDELTHLRSFYEGISQPILQGNQSLNTSNLTASMAPSIHATPASRSQSLQSSGLLSGSIGINLPSASVSQRFGGRTLPLDSLSLPNTPLQINPSSQSFPSQNLPSGISLPSMAQIRTTPSLPTTPLAPSDIDASSNTFVPRSIIKTSTTGINIPSPFPNENPCPGRTATIPAKKIKVEKTKKVKIIKDKGSESNVSIEQEQPTIKSELPTEEDNQKMKDGLNHIEANLKHLIYSYDSEATESSSGGESCDEFDGYLDTTYQQNQRDRESKLYQRLKSQQSFSQPITQNQSKSKLASHQIQITPPIKQRAKWSWLSNRAVIGSKWTWLTAQISDLEYRIRQQNDLVRQIRALKGPVTLGDPVILSLPRDKHAESATKSEVSLDDQEKFSKYNSAREYTEIFDSLGRKIIIREPISPLKNSDPNRTTKLDRSEVQNANSLPESKERPNGNGTLIPSVLQNASAGTIKLTNNEGPQSGSNVSYGSCRTRPLKQLRRRCILPTKGLYRSSARAAKESTVRCDCIHPLYSCAICFGRSNHTQAPDPVFQDRARTISLLDHSYHQVLSNSKSDVPLGLLIMQKLKNRSWMTVATAGSREQDALSTGMDSKRDASLTEKERRKEERRLKKLAAKAAAIASGKIEDTKSKNRKKYAAAKKRKLERELELELEEEGLLTGEITAEVLEAMLEERRRKLEAKKSSKTGVNSSKRRNSEGSNKEARKRRLKMLANSEKMRRKSVTVHHQADGNIHAMTDLAGGNGDDLDEIEASSVTSSSLPSPSVHGIHQLPTMEQIRRKRETAFDIDNIVIPYSTMASARVEKLKYKEIQTPVWRIVDEEVDTLTLQSDKAISTHEHSGENKAEAANEDCETQIAIKSDPEDKEEGSNETGLSTDKESIEKVMETLKKEDDPELCIPVEGIKKLDESGDTKKSDVAKSQPDREDGPSTLAMKPPISVDFKNYEKTDLCKTAIHNKQVTLESDVNENDNFANNVGLSKDSDNIEDISDIFYQNRHAKAEIEEQIRWRTPLWKSSGGQRAVHRSISSASSTCVRESRDTSNITFASSSINLGDGNHPRSAAGPQSGSVVAEHRTSQRQDSRSSAADKAKSFETGGSLSSGCNTPDPLSPSMVEKVDTLEVNTRPSTPTDSSTPINADGSVAAHIAASIRNRRRTSSATKSRDRNLSEDCASATSTAAHSRCTTPVDQQPANVVVRTSWQASGSGGGNWSSSVVGHNQAPLTSSYFLTNIEIRPFEPREFPLSEEKYNTMLTEDHKQSQKPCVFSSKVEVVPETPLIAGASELSSSAVHDHGETAGMFAALGGTSNVQSHMRGTSER